MLAVVRPADWEWPVFMHVAGAFALLGATAAVAVAAVGAARASGEAAALLKRLAFRTLAFAVLPAWLLMWVAAEWALGRESSPTGTWVDIGFGVADGGIVLLLVLTLVSWLGVRRGRAFGWIAAALATAYAGALVLALWAMTTKPA
jgi:hypothetical protein